MMPWSELVVGVVTWAPGVIFAITLHEWAHGAAAAGFGDPTPGKMGRLTLNPLPHIDLVWTILIPAVMLIISMATTGHPVVFGGAKPVPINPRCFPARYYRLAMFCVSLAGPLINLLLALLCALALRSVFYLPEFMGKALGTMLLAAIHMNVLLAVFNMLPLPPLDGGRVATALLPPPLDGYLASLERFGLPVILLLVFSGSLSKVMLPPLQALVNFYLNIAGLS